MAALHDLLPPLLTATYRDLSGDERSLSRRDLAGVAVLLGLSSELLTVPAGHRADGQAHADPDVAGLLADAQASLQAVRRATGTGAQS